MSFQISFCLIFAKDFPQLRQDAAFVSAALGVPAPPARFSLVSWAECPRTLGFSRDLPLAS